MSDAISVLPPEQEAIAQRVASLIKRAGSPVLPRVEAIEHVRLESDSAFDRWCAKWKVKPCANGRYSRGALDRALQLESRQRFTRKQAA